MISSMTGYGRAENTVNGCTVVVEAKSLNNRYLELYIRMPRKFSSFEEELEGIARAELSRGKVNFIISIEGLFRSMEELSINLPVAEQYMNALRSLEKKFDTSSNVSPEHLLKIDDIFEWTMPADKEEQLRKIIVKTFKTAVQMLKKHKKEEGKNLIVDFRSRLTTLSGALKKIKVTVKDRHIEDYENLKKRLQKVLRDLERIDPERLNTEAAIMAEKFDISEECVRLDSHIKMFRETLSLGGVVGRKLDFILQEMNREANTISSKSNNFKIASEVVVIKEEVERIKEQLRNVE
ncbi:MAG: YicC family protein [bacterium]|nr:YicC family protein [bacterium]